MPKRDPRIDAYIAKSAEFAKPILMRLRKLVHTACPAVVETMKWSVPHFEHKGVICGLAAFKKHCAFILWKPELVAENAAAKAEIKGKLRHLASMAELPKDKVILGYLKKAVALNEAGVKRSVPKRSKVKKELVVPDYFLAVLKKNSKALAAFEAFSYSHKKEYVQWITEAKREETRAKRVETTLKWLSEGKSRNWKYERC